MPLLYIIEKKEQVVKIPLKQYRRLNIVRAKQSPRIKLKIIGDRVKWFSNHCFFKIPLLVNQRNEFMLLAEKYRIALGEWFTSPLHPIEGDLSLWQFKQGQYPVAEYLASHVVNLPTTPNDIDKVLVFLEQYLEYVVDSDE